MARQTRERDEAAARMRAKFGASGGLNGKLGGCGPSGCGGGGGGSGSGLGLWSSLGSFAAAALESAAEVASSGAAAAATAVASGLERLPVRSDTSAHQSGGFGRESRDLADMGRAPSRATSVDSRTSSTVSLPSGVFASDVDEGGVEPLPGETDSAYAARQARLREAAAERMRAKFGASNGLSGKMGGCGPSDVGSRRKDDDIAAMLNAASIGTATPAPKQVFVPPVTSIHSSDIGGAGGRVKKVAAAKSQDNWDDFDNDW